MFDPEILDGEVLVDQKIQTLFVELTLIHAVLSFNENTCELQNAL